MEYAIVVLDIGKTNKKIVVYDENLKPLASAYRSISTVSYEELDVEDVREIETWFLEVLENMAGRFPIRAISITAHGATCAWVDEKGALTVPVVAYTNEAEEELHREFYREMGDPEALQVKTGTAQVKPLINLAKLIYFQKKRFRDGFAKTKKILFYPQYFGHRLTGKSAADCTYLGCHTYLWDFEGKTWSHLAEALGISDMLPGKVSRPGDVLGTISREVAKKTGLPEETLVTMGIHDSNSSLIPYLVKGEENFVLNSSGTWCVVMHPTKQYGFQKDEIGKTVFYNISARQELVKTAIFMGGLEFKTYREFIQKASVHEEAPRYSRRTVQEVLDRCRDFIVPGIVGGAGQFPGSDPRAVSEGEGFGFPAMAEGLYPPFFRENQYAYGVLNLSLALQTKVAVDRVKAPPGSPLYVEGGFRENKTYLALLASLYPGSPVYTTDIKEATSLGAAMLGKAAWENISLDELKDLVDIEMHRVEPEQFKGLSDYFACFLSYI